MANFVWDSNTKKMAVTLAQQLADSELSVSFYSFDVPKIANVSSWAITTKPDLGFIDIQFDAISDINNASIYESNGIIDEYMFNWNVNETLPIEHYHFDQSETIKVNDIITASLTDLDTRELTWEYIPVSSTYLHSLTTSNTLFNDKAIHYDPSFDMRSISTGVSLSSSQTWSNIPNKYAKYKKSIITVQPGNFYSTDATIIQKRQINELKLFKSKTVNIEKVSSTQLQLDLIPTCIANGKITLNPQKDIRAQKSINIITKTLVGGSLCYFTYKSEQASRTIMYDHKVGPQVFTVAPEKFIFKKMPSVISPTNVNGKGLPIIFDFTTPVIEQEWRTS